jgi:dTDP-4-dehydrorhamnose 3,5-epimerase
MHAEPLPIAGAMLLSPPASADDRGWFMETYSLPRYREAGILDDFVQDNVSRSHRNVVRGLHGDRRAMSKLVGVLAGEAYDVIVDVRPRSATFGRWCGITLNAAPPRQVYVPAGCLHGFLAVSDELLFLYKQSVPYDPGSEIGVRWDDPEFAVAWPLDGAVPILSERDAANPTARELGLLAAGPP